MIQAITRSRCPYLPIHVRIGDVDHLDVEGDIESLVDTAFDGDVLPGRPETDRFHVTFDHGQRPVVEA